MQKHIGFGLSILAIACFVPGILLPMFVLHMDMAVSISGTGFDSAILDKELSIIATVSELWQEQRHLVAFLIFAFSVLIPITKTALVGLVYFTKNLDLKQKLINFVAIIGKWSMADVFVVAVFLAILSTNHAETKDAHELGFFGMTFAFETSTETLSNVGQGFYYFLAYCVLSLIGSQLVLLGLSQSQRAEPVGTAQ